jgi:hypothetical protein
MRLTPAEDCSVDLEGLTMATCRTDKLVARARLEGEYICISHAYIIPCHHDVRHTERPQVTRAGGSAEAVALVPEHRRLELRLACVGAFAQPRFGMRIAMATGL